MKIFNPRNQICLVILLVFLSCKKGEVPTIKTFDIVNITDQTAVGGGEILNEGSSTIVSKGVCWSVNTEPSINDNKTIDGAGAGIFTSNISNLKGATTYFIRAYATNSEGTGYGMAMSFKTLGQAPNATTNAANSITADGATLNALINPNFLTTTATFEYGISTLYGQTIGYANSTLTGNNNINISVNITSLLPGTLYHFRIKVQNAEGISYGEDMTFTTSFVLRQAYSGGLIFYLDNTGKHGLIASQTDQSTGIQWYNGTNIPINTTSTALGKGLQNTQYIITAQGNGNYAAKICNDLVLNNYDDWYLPSKEELNLMYVNLKLSNLGNFSIGHYWSSTESSTNSNAWYQYFGDGAQVTASKDYQYYVRAIRAF